MSTIFVFLVIVNAFNFIDGIDGLAISITIKYLLIILFISNYISSITILNQLIISSLLPLYYFNYKKINKVFLGDSGSLLLGTVVSISLFTILNDEFIIVNDLRLNKAFLAVLLVIYPLLDLARVFFIRISNGKSPFHC